MDGDVRAVSFGLMILGALLILIGVIRMCFTNQQKGKVE